MKEVGLNDILRLIERSIGRHDIHPDDRLIERYGAESADIAGIVVGLEKKYQVRIPESALPELLTPRDFFDLVQEKVRDRDAA